MRWRAATIVLSLWIALGWATHAEVMVANAHAQQQRAVPCEIFLTEFTYEEQSGMYYVAVSLTEPCTNVGHIDPRLLDLQSGENIRFGREPIPVTSRFVEFRLPTDQLQPTRKYRLAIRAFQQGSETYVRRETQNAAEDPLNFAMQEFAYNPPAEVPIVFTVDGVRADFPNHKLLIAVHHSDTPKSLRYEAVIADRKGGGAVGRLDRTPLTLRNGIVEAPLPLAMEEIDRPAEYLLTFRLFTDKKLVGEQRKEFTLPAPPRPGPVERVTVALQTYPWLGWSIAGIVALLSLGFLLKELIPRKRKPLPRPQNLKPVFIQSSSPLLSGQFSAAVAYPGLVIDAGPPPEPRDIAPAPERPEVAAPLPPSEIAPPPPVDLPPGPTPVGRRSEPTAAFDPGTPMLIVTPESGPSREYSLNKHEMTIGRADDNDIVIKDIYVSRKHARIAVEGDYYIWFDRDEVTQPTRIDGSAVAGSQTLHDGDTIEVGGTVIVFRAGHPNQPNATPLRPMAAPTQARARGRRLVLVIGEAQYPVAAGVKVEPQALGSAGAGRAGAIAEVTANPNDAAVLGLRNLSGAPWNVALPTGQALVVEHGRSVRLDEGVRIDFGGVEGRIQA
jgi:hypothetical protein